jgi:hypothetical protein
MGLRLRSARQLGRQAALLSSRSWRRIRKGISLAAVNASPTPTACPRAVTRMILQQIQILEVFEARDSRVGPDSDLLLN